eukprot:353262-Chlamydomonas_euryale.AAC.5
MQAQAAGCCFLFNKHAPEAVWCTTEDVSVRRRGVDQRPYGAHSRPSVWAGGAWIRCRACGVALLTALLAASRQRWRCQWWQQVVSGQRRQRSLRQRARAYDASVCVGAAAASALVPATVSPRTLRRNPSIPCEEIPASPAKKSQHPPRRNPSIPREEIPASPAKKSQHPPRRNPSIPCEEIPASPAKKSQHPPRRNPSIPCEEIPASPAKKSQHP